MSLLSNNIFGFFLAEGTGGIGPTANVQLGGNPIQGHGVFRAQTPGHDDLFGVAIAAFHQFGGGPTEALPLFRHQAAGFRLVQLRAWARFMTASHLCQ